MKNEKFVYEMMKVEDINPARYNPREISEHAMIGLRESIKKFGIVDPLIVNIRYNDNTLCGGHQRLKAAILENYTEVPVVKVSLSRSEEKALNVTLNNKHIEGFFTESLNDLLQEIKSEIGDESYINLQLDALEMNWDSDMGKLDIDDDAEERHEVITIECPKELYDEVMIYIKAKLLETSFEGVHVR